jgi:von Willebrand factor type A domain/Trypsin-like peptidase domain
MSHITGTVQTVSPVIKIGPDFGPATNPPNTWVLNFAHTPAPGGSKLVVLHFTGVGLPASNRLEVDLGYDTDVFTAADGSDFWTRPVNIFALPGGLVPVRYITNGAATGGAQLDQYGRGERHTKDPVNTSNLFDSFSNCDPFLPDPSYTEPDYAKFWLCNMPPNWENSACSPNADIRSVVAPSVGMVMHVDSNPTLGFVLSTCTVTLVSADTAVTAGHCMADPIEDAESASVIFNYQTSCNGSRPGGYAARFFKVREVIRQRYADGSANDYCLLRLKVPPGGLGVPTRTLSSSLPAVGDSVFGIHHPNGAVKKLSVPHNGTSAKVTSSSATSIGVSLDVAGGSSGSALFDLSGNVLGVLSNGSACSLSYFPAASILQDISSPPAITRDVMLVFDRSGSMSLPGTSGLTKIEEARAAASLFVQLVRAGTGNSVGLVSFSTTASSPVDFALAPVTAPNKTTLIGNSPFTGGIIGGLNPGGSTTIGGGLNAAFGQLMSGPNTKRNVLLFTDGLQNTPPMVDPNNTAPTNIFIDVIGYGTPASLDGNMLTALAASHRGQYVLADTNLKLQKFFSLAFGNIFEAGILLDPEFVLPQGQQAAVPVPFDVCEEETLTVVVGWDNRGAQLAIQVTTPLGATITAASSGVDSSASASWTFLRIPLPQNGERDGKWQVTVFRPGGRGEFAAPSAETRYFVNVVAGGGAVLRPQPRKAKYYTGDTINPLVGLQYLKGGLPPNAKVKVTVARPDTSVGNLLSAEKLGNALTIDADTIPARQATLMAIEAKTGKPAVGYTQQTFDLFDDIASTNAPEPAGVFGNPLKNLLTVEGNYTFHFQATYGDACTATRELVWSVHVDPSIDPWRTVVNTTLGGDNKGTITVVPKDPYGNNIGPGRGGEITVSGAPGTTVTGPLTDNGDGSYTVPVSWHAQGGNFPGVVIGQPDRPPVVVVDPSRAGKGRCKKWKLLFWLAVLAALLFLVLWLLK